MVYMNLSDEFAKNLFVLKKTNREFSESQKNFWIYKGRKIENDILYTVLKNVSPLNFAICFVVYQYVDSINGKSIGKSFTIHHVFFLDDKKIIKYVKLNSKFEISNVEILSNDIEVSSFEKWENENKEAIEYFKLNCYSNDFDKKIKDKLSEKIIPTDCEKEEINRIYSNRELKHFCDKDGEIIIENCKISEEEKSFRYSYYSAATITRYYVFRGTVKGFAEKAKINVTFHSMNKTMKLLGLEGKDVKEYFTGKNIMFDGKFMLYGNTVIGSKVELLCEMK